MDCFRINKYSSIDDNILYIANNLMKIMTGSYKRLEKIIEGYKRNFAVDLGLNMETNIYLALIFLYSIGKISVKDNKLGLEVKK